MLKSIIDKIGTFLKVRNSPTLLGHGEPSPILSKEFLMGFMRDIFLIFCVFFPLLWIAIIEKIGLLEGKSGLMVNIYQGLGGCFSGLIFYLRELRHKHNMRKVTLQRVKERLNGSIVLISHQERIILGSSMKNFIKQPGRIANATNNVESLHLPLNLVKS